MRSIGRGRAGKECGREPRGDAADGAQGVPLTGPKSRDVFSSTFILPQAVNGYSTIQPLRKQSTGTGNRTARVCDWIGQHDKASSSSRHHASCLKIKTRRRRQRLPETQGAAVVFFSSLDRGLLMIECDQMFQREVLLRGAKPPSPLAPFPSPPSPLPLWIELPETLLDLQPTHGRPSGARARPPANSPTQARRRSPWNLLW